MFVIVATILFFILASIWNRKSWPNLIIKTMLWGMTLWGVLMVLQNQGYIVKT